MNSEAKIIDSYKEVVEDSTTEDDYLEAYEDEWEETK